NPDRVFAGTATRAPLERNRITWQYRPICWTRHRGRTRRSTARSCRGCTDVAGHRDADRVGGGGTPSREVHYNVIAVGVPRSHAQGIVEGSSGVGGGIKV